MSFPVATPVGIFTQLYKVSDVNYETSLEAQVQRGIEAKSTNQLWRISTGIWGSLRDHGYREWEGQG